VAGSVIFDVVLGLLFVFFVFSVASSKINEFVVGVLDYRAKQLLRSWHELIQDDALIARVLQSGVVRGVRAVGESAPRRQRHQSPVPSYMSARTFAEGLLDALVPLPEQLFNRVNPDQLPASAATAYSRARQGLTLDTATALRDAVPETDRQRPLLDQLAAAATSSSELTLPAAVEKLPESSVKSALQGFLAGPGLTRDRLREQIEHWYDDAMDRLSGWYKRRIQLFLLGYGAALAIAFNVDTVNIARTLWDEATVRAAVVAVAQQQETSPATSASAATDSLDTAASEVRAARTLSLPLGWTPPHQGTGISDDPRAIPATAGSWLLKGLGLLITVGALSFGATFWFDLLGKLVNLRNAGPKPSSSTQT
jgi:hypothetical protein